MSKLVIIIEDRKSRAIKYLGEEGLDKLLKFENVRFLSSLPDSFCELDNAFLIFAHKSLLVSKGQLVALSNYASKTGKYLVLFSGGQSASIYYNSHSIDINAKDFYSKDNLFSFLSKVSSSESDDIELLSLIYGERWLLPYLMEYQHIKWEYPSFDSMPEDTNDRLYELTEIIQETFGVDHWDDSFIESHIRNLSR